MPRWVALITALAALSLGLVDATHGALRLAIATAAALVLVGAWFAMPRAPGRPIEEALRRALARPLGPGLVAAMGSVAVAWVVQLRSPSSAGVATSVALWMVVAVAVSEVVGALGARSTLAATRELLGGIEGGPALARVGDLLDLSRGDRVREDLRVVTGDVVVELWGNPALRLRRVEADPIPSGAIVREGNARARVAAVSRDRAFARLLGDVLDRPERAAPRLRLVDRALPAAAAVVAIASIAVMTMTGRGQPTTAVVAAFAASLSLLVPPARRLALRDQIGGVVEACRRGAAFRDADSFARAAGVRSAIFALRGTLVAMAPDTCDVEAVDAGRFDEGRVLAMAAGAELALQHPVASAIQRAAQSRGARPLDVRNVVHEPGLGVRGELADGASLIVGSRALCLRYHVGTAEHEARIGELEATGRDVVIVARDSRVIGLLSMQSPLRAGALASMQRLKDVEVDPVLLGGASRGRLEAIGHAVDVEHVRPEVHARDRNAEVRRVAQSGGPVAVIGRATIDGAMLAAADVAIALADAGAAPDSYAISLAHDQLVPAVDVLALAQATRARLSATLVVGLAPALLAALPVAFGLIRPSYAPLAALAAAIALGSRELVAAALPEGGRMEDNERS